MLLAFNLYLSDIIVQLRQDVKIIRRTMHLVAKNTSTPQLNSGPTQSPPTDDMDLTMDVGVTTRASQDQDEDEYEDENDMNDDKDTLPTAST